MTTAAAAAAATTAKRPFMHTQLARGQCYCGNDARSPEHYVYVAFLKYENPRYKKVLINRVTAWFTGSEYIHCQLAFWDRKKQRYVTFSVDQGNPVFASKEKGFAAGWDFIRFRLTQREELTMYRFLHSQQGKPYNKWGHRLIALYRVSGYPTKWFCAELTLAAFQQIGWFLRYHPADMFPIDIYDLVCAQTEYAENWGHPVEIERRAHENKRSIRQQRRIYTRYQRRVARGEDGSSSSELSATEEFADSGGDTSSEEESSSPDAANFGGGSDSIV